MDSKAQRGKITPFAAQCLAEAAGKAANGQWYGDEVSVKGPGPGREAAITLNFTSSWLEIHIIKDVTPVPHNGCRPPKRPRG